MICPNINDPKVKREFGELIDVFGENVAHALWQNNTGYPLDFTKSGERSYLFDGLKRVTGSRERAMRLKALIYTGKARLREPSLDEFLRELRDAPFSKRASLNVPESELNRAGITKYLIADIKKSILSKKHIGSGTNTVDFVYPTPQQSYRVAHRIMSKLNKQYGSKVVSLDTSHKDFTRIYIMPNPDLADDFLKRELQVRAENMKTQEDNEFLARDRESNQRVNQEGDVVPFEDGDYMDYAPPESGNTKTFGEGFTNILEYYEQYDRRLGKRMKDLKTKTLGEESAEARHHQLKELTAVSHQVKQMLARLKAEASREGAPEVTIDSISIAAEMDMQRIKNILANPTPENLIEADAILGFYTSINIIDNKDKLNPLLKDVQLTGEVNHEKRINELDEGIAEDIQNGEHDQAALKQEERRRIVGEKMLLDQLNKVAGKAQAMIEPFEKAVKQMALIKLQEHPQFDRIAREGMTIDELFKDIEDIDTLSTWFLGPDFTFSGNDSIIAQVITSLFRDTLNDKDALSTALKEAIDQVEKETNAELKKNDETQADVFYQQDEYGNTRHYLIDKFSNLWFETLDTVERAYKRGINAAYKLSGEARQNQLNQTELDKFNALKATGEFVDPTKLQSLKQEFGHLATTFASDEDSAAYEQDLVDRLGQLAVDRIKEEQKDKFRQYNFLLVQKIRSLFEEEFIEFDPDNMLQDVQTRLSPEGQKKLQAFVMENSPAVTAGRAAADGNNIINGPYGYPIYAKTDYNVIIPKQGDTHFIDDRFEKIEGNDVYQKAWKALSDSIKYINSAISSGRRTVHNGLFEYRKNVWRTLFDKNVPAKTAIKNALRQLGDWAVNLVTGANEKQVIPQDETEISKAKFKEIKGKIEKATHRDLSILASMMGIENATTLSSAQFAITDLSQEVITHLADIAGVNPTATALEAAAGGPTINMGKYVESQHNSRIMSQQTLDLFKMSRYYLAEAARYDAAKTILPIIRILKRVYNNIKQPEHQEEETGAKGIVQRIFTGKKPQDRVKAVNRMDYWFNRVVRGFTGVKSMPIKSIKKLRTSEEKREAELLDKEIQQLEQQVLREMNTEQQAALKAKIDTLIEKRDSLGHHLDWVAFMGIIQTFIIFKGLAWNVKSSMINYLNGYLQSQIHDSLGYFWTPGNFDKAHSFVIGKGRKNFYRLATLGGKVDNQFKEHAEGIELAELFLGKVGIIQDVRDEKQKSTTRMGKEDLTNKALPFYISVTAIEWRNQGADILAVLMDYNITSKDGQTTVQMFDGKGFPAMEKKNGKLVLKEEFRTDENIKNWEKLTGKEYKKFKSIAQAAVVAAQGDYSPTSGMRAKGNAIGRTFMIFKTFLPMALWTRFGRGKILAAGVDVDQAMYKRHNPVTLGAAGGAMGFVAGGPMGAAIGAATGALAGRLINKRKNPELSYAKEYITIAKALVLKIMGTPANLVAGKRIEMFQTDLGEKLEGHLEDDQKKFTEQDVNAIQAIMKEISFLVWLAAMKYAFRAALSCDDEDSWGCKTRMRAADFIDNLTRQMFDDASLYMSKNGMLQLLAGDFGPFLRFIATAESAVDAINRAAEGEDLYVTGKDAGESRTYNSVRRVVAPGIFNTAEQIGSIFYHEDKLGPIKIDKVRDYDPDWMDRKFAPIEKRVKKAISQQRRELKNDLEAAGKSKKYIDKKLKEKHPTPAQKKAELKKMFKTTWRKHYSRWLEKKDEE